jgi:hypothetical protein
VAVAFDDNNPTDAFTKGTPNRSLELFIGGTQGDNSSGGLGGKAEQKGVAIGWIQWNFLYSSNNPLSR